MIYLASAAYPTDLRLYYPQRYSTDAGHAAGIKAKASADLARDFDVLVTAIADGPFILGKSLSAADLYAAMLISWSDDVPGLFARHGKLRELYAAVAENPKVRKVWDRNGMP